MVEIVPGYYLHKKIHSKLFPYQVDCLKWMYKLFQRRKGGVLGDDMGLGKTIQVIAYLAGEYSDVFLGVKYSNPEEYPRSLVFQRDCVSQ